MDKKFTPEEIAESLEVCQNTGIGCIGCVLDEHPDYSDVEIFCRSDLEKKAAEAIRELLEENKRLREERRWIPTSERLPEAPEGASALPEGTDDPLEHAVIMSDTYLVMIEGAKKSTTLYFDGEDFFDYAAGELIPYTVTHWRPMPKGPEAEA